jgi:hypothetical protein
LHVAETTLYAPVKRYLESLGFSVKGEVVGCDVVGLRDGAPPVVVVCELKLAFNLELLLQGVERAAACDEVWLAARLSRTGRGREQDRRFRALCRRLGFGLLGIDHAGGVHILLSPTALPPRRDPRRRAQILDEHRRRVGDPTAGGGSRQPIMTAYRQAALACAAALASGPLPVRKLRQIAPNAATILRGNYYGWFERADRGVYALTAKGRTALGSSAVAAA